MSVLNTQALSNRSFNVRVHIGEDGVPVLGWVHGMYEVSDTITDIKSIPKDEQAALARLLGIGASTNPHVARLLRGANPAADLAQALETAAPGVGEIILERVA